jgi:V8-like Glu-specific endopeptidase
MSSPRTGNPRAKAPAEAPRLRDAGDLSFPLGAQGTIGIEDRAPILDTSAPPWSRVCALHITAADGHTPLLGTGWLVGPRTVITAAHCLFVRPVEPGRDSGLAGYVREVTVIPALSGEARPFGAQTSHRFEVPTRWTAATTPPTLDDADHDYAAIFLDAPGFPAAGSFSFGVAAPGSLPRAALDIPGYPLDLGEGRVLYHHPSGRRAGLAAGRYQGDRGDRILNYSTDTSPGQSGAPVLTEVGGATVVIGIHTTGYRSFQTNAGRRIDDEVFDCLVRWKQEGSHG